MRRFHLNLQQGTIRYDNSFPEAGIIQGCSNPLLCEALRIYPGLYEHKHNYSNILFYFVLEQLTDGSP